MKLLRILLIILISLVLLNCTKDKKKEEPETLIFIVDSLLIGKRYTNEEIGVSFCPPKEWNQLSAELMRSIEQSLQEMEDSSSVDIILQNVFLNQKNSCICFLSTFQKTMPAAQIRNTYLTELYAGDIQGSINEGSYMYNGVNIRQIIHVQDDQVTIKLVCISDDEHIFMLDYIVPSKFYEQYIRSIESSIGTLIKNKRRENK
ncbi:MAG: hypothetical protein K8R49_09400 [Candidatus Cloacimonetes bacterium]|nr:hypothetical protein [Candidatus Cloacimonadota bacterium]